MGCVSPVAGSDGDALVNLKAGSPWPMFGHDRARRGLSTFNGAQSPGIKWSVTINGPSSSPGALTVDDDGTIYVPGGVNQPGGNTLRAVNPDGTTKWSIATGSNDGFASPPLIGADGTLYQTSYFGVLHALVPASGTQIWSYAGMFRDPSIRFDGTILGTNAGLVAVSPLGQLLWKHPLLPAVQIIVAPAVAADGTTYLSGAGPFTAVAADGSTRWQHDFAADALPAADCSSATIGTDGTVYVVHGTVLHALNPDGCELWKTRLDFRTGFSTSVSVGPDGTIYAVGSSGLYAVSPADGQVKWSYTVAAFLSSPVSIAIGADGTVYASIDGLRAFAPDGNRLWSFAGKCGAPAIGTGNTTLAVCDGKVTAFGVGAPITNPVSTGAVGSPTLDCSGSGPGSVVWTTIVPRPFTVAPPLPQQPPSGFLGTTVAGLGVGSTGHAFVAMASQPDLSSGQIVTIDELDSPGAPLGARYILGGPNTVTASLEVFGARDYMLSAIGTLPFAYWGGDLVSPAVRHSLARGSIGTPAVYITGTGNAAGERFERRPDAAGLVSLRKWTAAGAPVWNAPLLALGPPFHNGCDVSSLRADDAGAAYIAGQAEGACFCGVAAGPFVGKLDPAGQCLWAKPLFTVPTAAFRSIPTTGGVIVTDTFTGTADAGCGPMTSAAPTSVYLARLDAAGACLWSKSYDVPSLDVALFPGGDLLLSTIANGSSLGGAPLPAPGFALGRLDGSGVHQWSHVLTYVGPGFVNAARAITDPTGDFVLSGAAYQSVSFGAGPLSSPDPYPWYTYVLKFDGAGALLWQSAQSDASRVASDGCGAVMVASLCAQCAPGGTTGLRVRKLAP